MNVLQPETLAPACMVDPFGEAGNVTVSFLALSYAGTLTITAIADPDHFPDLPDLITSPRAELAALTS